MKLDRAELFHVQMNLVHPFRTSFGQVQQRQFILIQLQAEGLAGWGEVPVTAKPGYSYETVGTAWEVLAQHFIPAVLGTEFDDIPEFIANWQRLRGHPMARSGVEMAAWDLLGKSTDRSLKQMLGGTRDRVEVGVSIGLQSDLDLLMSRADHFLEQGYRRLKIKIEPGSDIDLVRALRGRFADVPLQVDANAAYSLADVPQLKQLDAFRLLMVEQPFAGDDLMDHAELQENISTPVCLDESIGNDRHARQAIEVGAARVINIKQARVGGLMEAVRIHDRCQQAGIPVWCGGLLESGVGRAANLALASLPGFVFPGDISATKRYYDQDLAGPEFQLEEGRIRVPTASGLGITVDHDRLKHRTLRSKLLD